MTTARAIASVLGDGSAALYTRGLACRVYVTHVCFTTLTSFLAKQFNKPIADFSRLATAREGSSQAFVDHKTMIGRAFHVERRVGGVWEMVPPPAGSRLWETHHHTGLMYLLCGGDPHYAKDHNRHFAVAHIAPCRGLPADVSAQVADARDHTNCGWGETYYSLAELLAFGWDNEVVVEELLCPAQYVRVVESGRLVTDSEELRSFVEREGLEFARERRFGQSNCASGVVRYRDTFRNQSGNFFCDLPHIEAAGNPDDVRIIAWWEE